MTEILLADHDLIITLADPAEATPGQGITGRPQP